MIFVKYQEDCENFYNYFFARRGRRATFSAKKSVKICQIFIKDLKKAEDGGIITRINI